MADGTFDNLSIKASINFSNNTKPMMYVFESGTANPERAIVAHSPAFANWGLFYLDNGDKMLFKNSGATVMSVDLGGKKVGIGTENPYTPLTVAGTVGFTNAAIPMMYIYESGTANAERAIAAHSPAYANWGLFYRDTDDKMLFKNNGASVMTVNLGGSNVGIGTEAPTEKLEVAGKVKATEFVTSSSRTVKENVSHLSGTEAIATLEALNPVKYNYTADAEKELHIGFIAEDVPNLVATSDRKGVVAMDIVAVLTKALQEQQQMIATLTQKVTTLEAQLA